MRLVSFRHGEVSTFGAVVDGGVVDLGRRMAPKVKDVRGLIAAGLLGEAEAIARSQAPDYAPNAVTLDLPIPNPGKIICVGLNYSGRRADLPQYPNLFMRSPRSLSPHAAPIHAPPESEQLDYEGEIALIIGKTGRRIPRERWQEHVAGYSVINEGSLRDWMRHGTVNITQGKNFDRSGGFGPWIETSPGADWKDMRVTTRVNGEVRQDDTTANIIFPFDQLLNYISTYTQLDPGDVISTGTPTGTGSSLKPPVWLRPGDTVEVEVQGVGTLGNPVVAEPVSGDG
jgi:2-keto-4-pentenoate hydratase/2-oxohepta-3-ene-1,7-dioic acid hydratase in catechol pathway